MRSPKEEKILTILRDSVSPILSKSILSLSLSWSRVNISHMRSGDEQSLLKELEKGVRLYVQNPVKRRECVERLKKLLDKEDNNAPLKNRTMTLPVTEEADIVTARGAGRELCQDIGFSGAMQIKVATAISELARNIVQYAEKGEIIITVIEIGKRGIEIVARDTGPGI
ncbi:MAG: anti-sigma regulatory factor, partial [Deltaproteobacteria bacterium]|nr:anti-sigma regulatory factor [Deltaproteobacteria bacterium]